MRLVRILVTGCAVGLGAAAVCLTVAALPDIKRYVRMSRM